MDRFVFSGLKVIDMATVIAGPAAAVMLADFGADVIKVEKPGTGDIMRQVGRTTTMPGADSDYMWNLEGPQQARHRSRPEAEGGHGRAAQAGRRLRHLHHQHGLQIT